MALTKINFRAGQNVVVKGSPDEIVAQRLRDAHGPIRLETHAGGVIFANWSNVLYIEEAKEDQHPVASVTPGLVRDY